MKHWMNEKGYLTVESALLMPLLLSAVCLFIVFFYFYLKIGAFQSLVNHQALTEALLTKPYFQVEQLEDPHSQILAKNRKVNALDEITMWKTQLQLKVTAPLGQGSVVLTSDKEQIRMPFLYQLSIAKRLGQGLEGIRNSLEGNK